MTRLPIAFDPDRSLPEQVGEWLDEAALTLACPPYAEQIDRLDVVLGWIPLIEDRQQKTVVHMRLIRHPISGENRWKWEQIGKQTGV